MAERLSGGSAIEPRPPAEEETGVVPERQIGVGHGRLAAAIAMGPGWAPALCDPP